MPEGNGISEATIDRMTDASEIPPALPSSAPAHAAAVPGSRRRKNSAASETTTATIEADAAREEILKGLDLPPHLLAIYKKLSPEDILTLEEELKAYFGQMTETAFKNGYAQGLEAGRLEKQKQIESLPMGRVLNVLGAATSLRNMYTHRAEDGSIRDLKGLGRAIEDVVQCVEVYEQQVLGSPPPR
jgi:hypothetical protein